MKKVILLLVILISICVPAFATEYYEINGDILPAIITYIPEEYPYFERDSTGFFGLKASAKVGTLSFVWNPDTNCTDYRRTGDNWMHQLYMYSDNGYNELPNRADLPYLSNLNLELSMGVKLWCIVNANGERKAYEICTDIWGTNVNPALIYRGTTRAGKKGVEKFRPGDYIEFYLVTNLAHNPLLTLVEEHSLRVSETPYFRDVTYLSYRLNNNSLNRCETSSKNNTGFSLFSSWVLTHGIEYNHNPLEGRPDPVWAFNLVATATATMLDTMTNDLQHVAIASLVPISGYTGEPYVVEYMFSSVNDTRPGTPFVMREIKGFQEGALPYDLIFSVHGSSPIEKGKSYYWYVPAGGMAEGNLYVKNLNNGIRDGITEGTWSDTIVIYITAVDGQDITSST